MKWIARWLIPLLVWLPTAGHATTLSRVTLSVSDPDDSLAFYRDLLGFTVSARADYDTPAMRAMFDIPGGSTPTLILLDGADGQPRALALVSAPGMRVDPDSNRRSAPALVFNTTDMDRIHRHMLAAGMPVVQPPTPLLDFRQQLMGREAMYLDPDGIRVVLFEYAVTPRQ